MTLTYWHDTPAGRLSIRSFNKGRWRLWAGDEFIGSFETPEDARQAAVKLGKQWKAPADLEDWMYAAGRLPPTM